MTTAIVLGASGAIGRELVRELENSGYYEEVFVIVRTPIVSAPSRIKQITVASIIAESLPRVTTNADVFCCLGTTIKKAGSRDAFIQVDFFLVEQVAQWAKKMDCKSFHVISSVGANIQSKNLYLQTKGRMEKAILEMGFARTYIYRPSLLYGGKRGEFRPGESISLLLMYPLKWLPFEFAKHYAPVKVATVAKSMLSHALDDTLPTGVIDNIHISRVLYSQ